MEKKTTHHIHGCINKTRTQSPKPSNPPLVLLNLYQRVLLFCPPIILPKISISLVEIIVMRFHSIITQMVNHYIKKEKKKKIKKALSTAGNTLGSKVTSLGILKEFLQLFQQITHSRHECYSKNIPFWMKYSNRLLVDCCVTTYA